MKVIFEMQSIKYLKKFRVIDILKITTVLLQAIICNYAYIVPR